MKNGAYIVYPCHAVIVSMEVTTGQQQFFMGHTDKVSIELLDELKERRTRFHHRLKVQR